MTAPLRRAPRGYYLADGEEPAAPKPRKAKAPRPLEAAIQVAIVRYLRLALPGAVIHASPGGAKLAGNARDRGIAMHKLKSMGMLVGFPDLIVLWRGSLFALEVKRSGEDPDEDQLWVGRRIVANGGKWAVVRSVDDAKACLAEWRTE